MSALQKQFTVRLHHTDAAGILFFANHFLFVHDIYEDFLDLIGWPTQRFLDQENFLVPIVHAESQYFRSLRTGDQGEISVTVANIGTTSYTLEYEITALNGDLVGKAKTVHVTVDKTNMAKIPLPDGFRKSLQSFRPAL